MDCNAPKILLYSSLFFPHLGPHSEYCLSSGSVSWCNMKQDVGQKVNYKCDSALLTIVVGKHRKQHC